MKAIQEIFEKFYDQYTKKYNVSKVQRKAVNNILSCRTVSLGCNAYKCDNCENTEVHYNSCRNRHCPCCQAVEKEIWADKRLESTIDTPYFHLVFTLPEQLRMLIYNNQILLYNLMYEAVNDTISKLSWDKKYLGAQIGFLSILHTWGDDIRFHPHIHAVVMAGGLTKNKKWRQSSKKFFIPVKVLSKLFKGIFLSKLRIYYDDNHLRFNGEIREYRSPKAFNRLLNKCYELDWYTYSKRTFSDQSALVGYLSRYTHRIAISNYRILSIDDDTVTFKTKKGKKSVTIKGVEFIRRFLMHVLPKGFVKIRSYGLLANRNKKTKLALCRILTATKPYKAKFANLNKIDIICSILGYDIRLCTVCKTGNMIKLSGYT